MFGVHLRHEQRHHGVHAVIACVAHHDVSGGGKRLLDFAGNRRIERREDHLRRTSR
jgi:hypothetical protein